MRGNDSKRRGRPCSVCGVWFVASPRVRHRQRTCGAKACQRALRARTQADWRRRNPDYWAERRLREQMARMEAGGDPPIRPPPALLRRIPVDLVQDEIGLKQFVIIVFLARLLQQAAQDEMRSQIVELEAQFGRIRRQAAQDETDVVGRPP